MELKTSVCFAEGQKVIIQNKIPGVIVGYYFSQGAVRYEISYLSDENRHVECFPEYELEKCKDAYPIGYGLREPEIASPDTYIAKEIPPVEIRWNEGTKPGKVRYTESPERQV